jgi:hypothetical protein
VNDVERTRAEVMGYINDFLNKKGDDFVSIPIDDAELEQLRWLFGSMPDLYPPDGPGRYCSDEGLAEMRRILTLLREGKW